MPETGRINGRGERHRILKHDLGYATMTVDAICALPIGDLAESDAHLYLWITPGLNRAGVGVRCAEAWGFKVVSEIIWAKRNWGLGAFPRPQHEPLLVCRRGRLPFNVRNVGSVQTWDHPRRWNGSKIHSAKPDAALDIVEQASPGPYAELFSRRARLGWSYPWGDQALGGVAV
jgi:N6-adenosine-specific RNA methylase IME4